MFREDFFDGLGPVSVRKLAFRIKVVNKGSSLKRDTLLGKKQLPLTSTTALLVEALLPSGSCREALMLRLLLGVSWIILFQGLLLMEEKKEGCWWKRKGQLARLSPSGPQVPCPHCRCSPLPEFSNLGLEVAESNHIPRGCLSWGPARSSMRHCEYPLPGAPQRVV